MIIIIIFLVADIIVVVMKCVLSRIFMREITNINSDNVRTFTILPFRV